MSGKIKGFLVKCYKTSSESSHYTCGLRASSKVHICTGIIHYRSSLAQWRVVLTAVPRTFNMRWTRWHTVFFNYAKIKCAVFVICLTFQVVFNITLHVVARNKQIINTANQSGRVNWKEIFGSSYVMKTVLLLDTRHGLESVNNR